MSNIRPSYRCDGTAPTCDATVPFCDTDPQFLGTVSVGAHPPSSSRASRRWPPQTHPRARQVIEEEHETPPVAAAPGEARPVPVADVQPAAALLKRGALYRPKLGPLYGPHRA